MGVLCFGSLKGGVGKTSVSVNVSHAMALRGCNSLLIDLDPMAHASRYFRSKITDEKAFTESGLGRLLVALEAGLDGDITELANDRGVFHKVRDNLSVITATPELRHFLWGKGARTFKEFFSVFVKGLAEEFDNIVIDTAPDFNILTRSAIAASDLVTVPVDSSAMSIHCLEEILASAGHIEGPDWLILRSMVNRQASRVSQLSSDKLNESFGKSSQELQGNSQNNDVERNIVDSNKFISMVNSLESKRVNPKGKTFLLRSIIHRTEEQNRLSFMGKTSFDPQGSASLKQVYIELARELEQMLAFREEQSYPEISSSASNMNLSSSEELTEAALAY